MTTIIITKIVIFITNIKNIIIIIIITITMGIFTTWGIK